MAYSTFARRVMNRPTFDSDRLIEWDELTDEVHPFDDGLIIEAGALIRELAPQTVTLEDLFFSLTEGPGAERGAEAPSEPQPVEAS